MLIKLVISIFIALLSLPVYAGWESGEIQKILVHDNGQGLEKVDIKLSGVGEGGMEWCNASKEWVVYLSSEASKAQYSLLLSAFMAGKSVVLHSDNGANCIDGQRNRIRNVEIKL